MSSNNSNCTCTCTCTRTESVTKNGHTVQKTTHVDSKRNPDGLYTTKTTSVDTIIDPQGHKTSKTSTNTETGKEVDFDSKLNRDFDAEFKQMRDKMDADFNDFQLKNDDHPALK